MPDESDLLDHRAGLRFVVHAGPLFLFGTPLHRCAGVVVGRLAGDALDNDFHEVGLALRSWLAVLQPVHHVAEPARGHEAHAVIEPFGAALLGAHIASFAAVPSVLTFAASAAFSSA